mgnify:CR=1 FL=1
MNKKITIGSRGSKLALIYAEIVKEKIIDNTLNPLAEVELPEDFLIHSRKPILCGRMDSMLNRIRENYGETPVVFGHAENKVAMTGETIHTPA